MRNNVTLAVLIAGGFIAACPLLLLSPAAAAQKTVVTMYSPWTASGKLAYNMRVAQTISGDCWTDSIVTSRGGAYRCMAGNDILDPCFAAASHPREVACAPNPFSTRIVMFKLSKPLPSGTTPMTQSLQPHNQPWGLRLTNGDKCTFAWGATDVVRGERLNYSCEGKDGWIIGQPDHSTPLRTALSSDYPKKHVTRVSIAEAIF
jgi:hypothetical protein